MQEFSQRLRLTVQELVSPVEFFQEALDLERFAGRDRSSLTEYFDDKYRGFGIDVVVPIGTRALQFAVDEFNEVFSDVPIVFALGSTPPIDTSALPGNVTGRVTSASRFVPTLAMARSLQPDAERIVVVGGAGPIDSMSVSPAISAAAELRDTLQLTVLQGLPLDTLLRELHKLPKRSIVLFANYRQDGQGQTFESIDIIGTIARAAPAPIYVQLREYVGEGVVGGSVIAMADEADRTGRLIVHVLRRRPGDPMPPLEPVIRGFVADWRQLRRWGLSEARLPPGTALLFREQTLWQRYRTVVLLTVGVIGAEFALIGSLLLERRRRKRAQMILEDEQRRAEEARLQVAHLGRAALVGELAATLSHELRQPLAAIRTNAEAGDQLLARASGDPAEARAIFQSIVSDDIRAVHVIESVRKLLRKDQPVVATIDLNQVCQEAASLLHHDAARRKTRLELCLASTAPMVTGDPVQLQQVVLNLMLNGLDAASMSQTDRYVAVHTESCDGHVELLVHDSGPGLSPTVRPHLFESFFSTKKEGLGLGLVIVRSIVERHSGRIQAENHPSGGAVFRIRLPRAYATQPPDASEQTMPRAQAPDARAALTR
jgi:signal transduction histidine kinase